jgi:hypothetical protein
MTFLIADVQGFPVEMEDIEGVCKLPVYLEVGLINIPARTVDKIVVSLSEMAKLKQKRSTVSRI